MNEKEFLEILKEVLENKLKFEPNKQQAIYESVKNKITKKLLKNAWIKTLNMI